MKNIRSIRKCITKAAAGIAVGLLCCQSITAFAAGSVITTDHVRIRKGPSLDSEIITVLNPGTELPLISQPNAEWDEVQFNGSSAYIARQFVSERAAASDTAAQSSEAAQSTPAQAAAQAAQPAQAAAENGSLVSLDPSWKFADYSAIHTGSAVMYRSTASNRKNIVIGVNAGHGTKGGESVKTWCHPDQTPKVTGGTTSAGNTKATAISSGMNFKDGTRESTVTLQMARVLRDMLLQEGYDVLMLRDGDDVQLDNIARTVICNNMASCHIAIHWDSDGLSYDKGCFYMSVPDGIKYFEPVASTWQSDEALGEALIAGLRDQGIKIFSSGSMDMDLTQTSYSSVPSVDIELGNQCSSHGEAELIARGRGMVAGINRFFGQ